jgi:hypothetical protein
MRFNELARNAEQDDYGTWDIDDTRRPRLTLRHLNKLRNMQELAKAEHIQKITKFKDMYSRGGGE